ncbi:zinc transport system permease protein [Salsuginibacillus halophilus]|uniref:Zinc transport system permease protein n=1 Tax=Salsuginibacillus halophilus TaxID=517424 RepID=A0A2P8HFJ1_9BACI|nr:metal ABC transporter permease [Salsuginibacillus halophilus]PSL44998.1 zinc transport system permease protein [Salsuginibacillus halophilus]
MELLQELTFIQRGVFAAVLVGLICPLIGVFLLVRRMTIISESLSHVTLTGISAGVLAAQVTVVFQNVNPMYFGAVFALVGSLLIERLRAEYQHFQELAVPIILSAGIGLSAVFISIADRGYNEWFTYLFGSIVSVTLDDLQFMIITAAVVLAVLLFFFKELLAVSFDPEFAGVSGISTGRVNALFAVLIALTIAMSMKVVGILLVGALVTLPAAAAFRLAKSFRQNLILSVLFGQISVLTGVYTSYHLNVATGGTIVMTAVLLLIAAHGIEFMLTRRNNQRSDVHET